MATKTDKPVDLEAVRKQIEEMKAAMLADVQQEAEKILAKAREEAAQPAENHTDEETKRAMADLEERVTITLFKDNGRYKAPVYLAVNGNNCVIERGKPVAIKKKFLMLLEDQKAQVKAAAENDEYWQSQFGIAQQEGAF